MISLGNLGSFSEKTKKVRQGWRTFAQILFNSESIRLNFSPINYRNSTSAINRVTTTLKVCAIKNA
jgi:hypothetical protein